MDFPKFQKLVTDRDGFGVMENPSATGEYISDSCGDMYTFYLKVDPSGKLEDVSYFTTGCGFGIATCAIVTKLAKGKTIDEAEKITTDEVEAELSGYPARKKEYPERVIEALRVALTNFRGSAPPVGAEQTFAKLG